MYNRPIDFDIDQTEEPVQAKITKIASLEKPYYPKDRAAVVDGESRTGYYVTPPYEGESFLLIHDDGVFCTSEVRKVWRPNGPALEFPEGFPTPEHVDGLDIQLGDIVLATRNSVYLVRHLVQTGRIDPCLTSVIGTA
jgi:hypothetical protein